MFLNEIKIENFKSLKDIKFEPSKITILIGPNSGGKSSILQVLSVMKQSFHNHNQNGHFSTNGHIVNLGSFEEVIWNHDLSNPLKFSFKGNIEAPSKFADAFHGHDFKFSYGTEILNQEIQSIDIDFIGGQFLLSSHITRLEKNLTRLEFNARNISCQSSWSNTLIPSFSIQDPGGNTLNSRLFNNYFQQAGLLIDSFKDYHYIPASRVIDEYSLPFVDVYSSDDIISSKGRDSLSNLLSYLSSNPNVTDKISEWTKKLIGKTIRAKTTRSDDQREKPNITLEYKKGNIERSIINEGTGPNQIILLLSMLSIIKPNSVIGIEEPEIHLHPKAQSELAKILLDITMTQNHQIIFTTHSEHILFPFLNSVASKKEGTLDHDQLAIYYFDADDDNISSCEKLEIDEYGRIKGGLRGFFEEEIDSLDEYLEGIKND